MEAAQRSRIRRDPTYSVRTGISNSPKCAEDGGRSGAGYIAQARHLRRACGWHSRAALPAGRSHWEDRDRFCLSIGHYAIALYSVLIEAGIIPEHELETYGSDDSRLPMSGMASIRRAWRSPAARSPMGSASPSGWRSG